VSSSPLKQRWAWRAFLSNHVPVPLVAKQLGHANPGVTMQIYAHVVGSSEVVSRAIEEVLPNGEEARRAKEGPKTPSD